MAISEQCDNDYDNAFVVSTNGKSQALESQYCRVGSMTKQRMMLASSYSPLCSPRSYVVQAGLLKAEWQPPTEVPEPSGPAEMPESEPEQPMPAPDEAPAEPEEVPAGPPPEVRLSNRGELN